MVFDANSPAYRSCCCHARTCTIVIGILELIGLIGQLVRQSISYAQGSRSVEIVSRNGTAVSAWTWDSGPGSLAISIVALVIGLIVVILLFVGICKENHKFLIPHLIYQVLGMLGMIAGIVLLILTAVAIGAGSAVVASSATDKAASDSAAVVGVAGTVGVIIVIVILVIALLFEIWFFIVVLKCYRFFRDQRAAGALNHGDQPVYYKT